MSDRALSQLTRSAVAPGLIALGTGALLWIPVFLGIFLVMRARENAPRSFSCNYQFRDLPGDDEKLKAWFAGRNDVHRVEIKREEGKLKISFQSRASKAPAPPWEELGYGKLTSSGSFSMGPVKIRLSAGTHLFLLARCLDVGFLLAGVWWLRRRGETIASLHRGRTRSALLLGALSGIGMAAVLWLCILVLPALFGSSCPLPGSGWLIAAALPLWSRILIACLVPITPPLCQEVFFRGALFGSLASSGRARAAAIISAAAFALVQLDPAGIPVYLGFGLLLAWLYRKTGSILAPLAASAVSHALFVSIAVMLQGGMMGGALRDGLSQFLQTFK